MTRRAYKAGANTNQKDSYEMLHMPSRMTEARRDEIDALIGSYEELIAKLDVLLADQWNGSLGSVRAETTSAMESLQELVADFDNTVDEPEEKPETPYDDLVAKDDYEEQPEDEDDDEDDADL